MSKKIQSITGKKVKKAIGLNSGTSVDAIDAVLIRISGSGTSSKLEVLDFINYPVPTRIKDSILKNTDVLTAKVDELCRLNVIIGQLFFLINMPPLRPWGRGRRPAWSLQ